MGTGVRIESLEQNTEVIPGKSLLEVLNSARIFRNMESTGMDTECLASLMRSNGSYPYYNIAIDLGTTTISIVLMEKDTGKVVRTVSRMNSQRIYGLDVLSRIQAANEGKGQELRELVQQDLLEGIEGLLEVNGSGFDERLDFVKVEKIALAGNTTMLHLLLGYSCENLGKVPFRPVNLDWVYERSTELGEENTERSTLFENQVGNETTRKSELQKLPELTILPGISVFVGADIVAGLLYCNFHTLEKPCLFLDLGTNGEMALGNKDKILVSSVAVGPAFEGGNIAWGVPALPGAIDHVKIVNGKAIYHTIEGKPAAGICGSGVLEIVYELIKNGLADETGMMKESLNGSFELEDGNSAPTSKESKAITFTQKDLRELQLAKSAVRAGIETLLLRYGITYEEVDQVFLAGGFGTYFSTEAVVGIGMLPKEFSKKTVSVGNSSLEGVKKYLVQEDESGKSIERIISISKVVPLSLDNEFNKLFLDYISF